MSNIRVPLTYLSPPSTAERGRGSRRRGLLGRPAEDQYLQQVERQDRRPRGTQEKEYLEDLSQELELADEDEPVRYKIGDSFIHLTLEDAQARIARDQEVVDQQLEEVKTRIDDVTGKMGGLKTQLYAKFGKAINLEKD
ncbi:hypothetical protein BC936DRAFT_149025 [Jimgerdemannia flammicorona]|uniref:Prefoldin subunit 4 n=1 Tax=Jimgerdemannia flammicorona TaxID=994334 RepID=A0A433D1R0_9FUNG|nr:hypothetical protein BC936DRAFT_149025 [Jimgerdemannia flammicorona]